MDWIPKADGVFRGGGVKGLALAGALVGFAEDEEKPVTEWVNVAGASAGAIIACYLACRHTPDEMLKLMEKTNFGDFQDFPRGGKWFGGLPNLVRRHGLARGDAFRDWFRDKLECKKFKDVLDETGESKLKLIAVDVTNRDMLVLPNDLERYRLPDREEAIDWKEFDIAEAARMSMSIPYFFEPVTLIRDRVAIKDPGDSDLKANQLVDRVDFGKINKHLQTDGSSNLAATRPLTADEQKQLPSTIVDGGTVSNFPVWLFDTQKQEELTQPTFGFTLSGGKGVGATLNKIVSRQPWAVRIGFDIFHTAQEAWDDRFVSYSTRVRTVVVDAADIGTTQFNLSDKDQKKLINNGRTAAAAFLKKFDLEEYVNTYHLGFGGPSHNGGGNGATAASVPPPLTGKRLQ